MVKLIPNWGAGLKGLNGYAEGRFNPYFANLMYSVLTNKESVNLTLGVFPVSETILKSVKKIVYV